MIVRKLRLERGWSQDQLAQMSGLNIRTIQRIEAGHKAGLESMKSLAAVFEVDVSELTQMTAEDAMTENPAIANSEPVNPTPATQEHSALSRRVLKISLRFGAIIPILWAINLMTYPHYLWAIYPTISIIFMIIYIAATAATPNDPKEIALINQIDPPSYKRPNRKSLSLKQHAVLSFGLCSILFAVNLMTWPYYLWAIWGVIGAAVGLLIHMLVLFINANNSKGSDN